MSNFDTLSLSLGLFGIGLNFVFGLVSAEWKAVHKRLVTAGHMVGFLFIGLAVYVVGLMFVPASWGNTMLPKVSMVIGGIFLIGGLIWQSASTGQAQPPGDPSPMSEKPPVPPSPPGGGGIIAPNNSGIVAPNNSGIVTHGQTGGSNTIINHGPEKLKFTDALGQDLLAKLPRDKEIRVEIVGSPSDQAVGRQITDFLQTNGYRLQISRSGMMVPPPDNALTWIPYASYFLIAPSAR